MGKGLVHICNSSLDWFTVRQCAVVDEAMPVISSFSKLITLSLIGVRVTDGSVRNLGRLSQIEARCLSIVNVSFSVEGLTA